MNCNNCRLFIVFCFWTRSQIRNQKQKVLWIWRKKSKRVTLFEWWMRVAASESKSYDGFFFCPIQKFHIPVLNEKECVCVCAHIRIAFNIIIAFTHICKQVCNTHHQTVWALAGEEKSPAAIVQSITYTVHFKCTAIICVTRRVMNFSFEQRQKNINNTEMNKRTNKGKNTTTSTTTADNAFTKKDVSVYVNGTVTKIYVYSLI